MYLGDILAPQALHFPLSISQLKTGIRSYRLISVPQVMQWELLFTSDSPLGSLRIHTFRKLPIVIPKRNTKTYTVTLNMVSTVARSRLPILSVSFNNENHFCGVYPQGYIYINIYSAFFQAIKLKNGVCRKNKTPAFFPQESAAEQISSAEKELKRL